METVEKMEKKHKFKISGVLLVPLHWDALKHWNYNESRRQWYADEDVTIQEVRGYVCSPSLGHPDHLKSKE